MMTERTSMEASGQGGIGRRTFLGVLAGGACTLSLGGCASVAVTRLTPVDGRVRIVVADHPRLAEPGGYLRVQPEGAGELIYLVTLGTGGYAALSSICTHLGCTVDVQGGHLVCPCHGSTYERDGRVVRGPAEVPLRRYPVTVVNGVIEVGLGGGA
jgi:cytochrome b6-f complex iron-sulfur subunit